MTAYNQTLTCACAFAAEGRIEEWIHTYLCSDGHNKPFSDGLKLAKRFYIGPVQMPLALFRRCCGPEEDMKWRTDVESFRQHVAFLETAVQNNADLPPLLIQYGSDGFTLTDGNHRWEAYHRIGLETCSVIVWGTGKADEAAFRLAYEAYLKN